MHPPDDPLRPPRGAFAEPWHAQTLALAQGLVDAGRLTPAEWSAALGQALAEAQAAGADDTEESYFTAALTALERVTIASGALTQSALADRKAAWSDAYRRTPHGQPVTLFGTSG